jgi:hypothetical protein
MKVFDKAVVVQERQDGSFTLSTSITDNNVFIKSISRKDAEILRRDLERVLSRPTRSTGSGGDSESL